MLEAMIRRRVSATVAPLPQRHRWVFVAAFNLNLFFRASLLVHPNAKCQGLREQIRRELRLSLIPCLLN